MSVEQVSLVLSVTGLCLGILICCILLLANKTQVHANRLLAITVFGLTLAMLQAFLIYTGYLEKFPHFFRIPSPFYYLSLATSYLYVRAVLNDETSFKKYDMIHFLPATLHLVELMPFYLKSGDEKREIIQRLLQDPGQIVQLNEGMLPPYIHNLIRSTLGIIYFILMVRLLVKASRVHNKVMLQSASFMWLKWFTGLVGLAALSILLILLVPSSVQVNKTLSVHFSVIVCFVVLNFYLFFKPQILYGIPKLRMENIRMHHNHQEAETSVLHGRAFEMVEESQNKNEKAGTHTSLDYLLAYKPALEMHLDSKKPYLQQGYNVAKLSLETGIPQHHLSALLNKVYGVRFNDFINQYRIKHITNHFDQSEWDQMTLEGIASEAGFNSRTTFFNAIKKSTGLSPSEFINKVKAGKPNSQKDMTSFHE
jgi:AraC-like DNA-binding protein